MDFKNSYQNSINNITIPELSVMEIWTNHKERKERFHKKIFFNLLCTIIFAMSISSVSVYAYELIQREIRHTNQGYLIDGSGKSSEGNTYHDYEVSSGTEKKNLSFSYEEEKTEISYYNCWQDAKAVIPYKIVYPDIDYPILIAVQNSEWFSVEAVYDIDTNQELSIFYRFFKNDKWKMDTQYNGNIEKREVYINEYGNSFEKITVSLDKDIFDYYLIAYNDKLVQIQFKNVSEQDQMFILNQMNLNELGG